MIPTSTSTDLRMEDIVQTGFGVYTGQVELKDGSLRASADKTFPWLQLGRLQQSSSHPASGLSSLNTYG